MVSDSELSDDFSLDTVGSYGDVKCKGRTKDYLVRLPLNFPIEYAKVHINQAGSTSGLDIEQCCL